MGEDGWGEMKIVFKCLKETKDMKLMLRVESLSVMNWWIYASYNTYDGCRGHTGSMTILGKGGVIRLSLKQKLNLNSSIEGE